MSRVPSSVRLLAAVLLGGVATALPAQQLLIRDATVHTVTPQGRLEQTDVLVRDGRIAAVGVDLPAAAGVTVLDAAGRPLTPGLFAGLTGLGLEEIPAETPTVDHALAFGAQEPALPLQWRPEFFVLPAFNPESAVIDVNRVEGLTFTMLAPTALAGGNFVAGQGVAVSLNGQYDAALAGSKALFVDLGSDAAALAGGSRAAQYMLLEQAIAEASGGAVADPPLLTPQGRAALKRYLGGDGRVVFLVDRAADIRQVLEFARRHRLQAVIAGAAEAWKLADLLAEHKVPVLLDPLQNLPDSFDLLGARLDNAARLHRAGVTIGFMQTSDPTHNARKIRQSAGNAVANGLPWEAGLAALTRDPARMLGIDDRGTIAVGQVADLVLWSGDPLEITSWAEQVLIAGVPQSLRSRQTELLERYRERLAPR